MSILTGKEALIALANGEEVEYYKHEWMDVNRLSVRDLTSSDNMYKFRLKPRTITLNGIEIPTCGDDYKPHTFMFVLNSLEPCEYSKIILDESDEIPPYWWKSEEEIKQVVAALRSIFK